MNLLWTRRRRPCCPRRSCRARNRCKAREIERYSQGRAAALEKQGTVVELVKMEGAGHGGFGKDPAQTLGRLNAFLVKYLLKP